MGMFRGGGLKAVVLARAFAFNTGGGLRIGGGALLVIDDGELASETGGDDGGRREWESGEDHHVCLGAILRNEDRMISVDVD